MAKSLVDINKCTVRDLTTKVGLALRMARKIIIYKRNRRRRPAISSMDELWNIPGMNCKIFEKLMQNYKSCNSSLSSSNYSFPTSTVRSTTSKKSVSSRPMTRSRKRKLGKRLKRRRSPSRKKRSMSRSQKARSVSNHSAKTAPVNEKNTNGNSQFGGVHSLALNPIAVATSHSRNRLFVTYKPGMSHPFAFLSKSRIPQISGSLKSQTTAGGPSSPRPRSKSKSPRSRKSEKSPSHRSRRSKSRNSESPKSRKSTSPLPQVLKSPQNSNASNKWDSQTLDPEYDEELENEPTICEADKRKSIEAWISEMGRRSPGKRRKTDGSPSSSSAKRSKKGQPKTVHAMDNKPMPQTSEESRHSFRQHSRSKSRSRSPANKRKSMSPKECRSSGSAKSSASVKSSASSSSQKMHRNDSHASRESSDKEAKKQQQQQQQQQQQDDKQKKDKYCKVHRHHKKHKNKVRFDSNVDGRPYQVDQLVPPPQCNKDDSATTANTTNASEPVTVYAPEPDLGCHKKRRKRRSPSKCSPKRKKRVPQCDTRQAPPPNMAYCTIT